MQGKHLVIRELVKGSAHALTRAEPKILRFDNAICAGLVFSVGFNQLAHYSKHPIESHTVKCQFRGQADLEVGDLAADLIFNKRLRVNRAAGQGSKRRPPEEPGFQPVGRASPLEDRQSPLKN